MRRFLIIFFYFTLFLTFSQKLEVNKIEIGCINVPIASNSYVFNSAEEMSQELSRIRSPHPSCSEMNTGKFDFSKYSVIGMKVNLGGCKKAPDLYPELEMNDGKVTLTMFFKEYGNCRRVFQSYHWFLIPKIDKKYVVFNLLLSDEK